MPDEKKPNDGPTKPVVFYLNESDNESSDTLADISDQEARYNNFILSHITPGVDGGPDLGLDILCNLPKTLTKEEKQLKWIIIKNVVVISVSFMILFSALRGITTLLSPIIDKTLQITSLWVFYVSLIVSCAFMTSYLIKKVKLKWTLCVSMVGYSAFISSYFYPSYYTLVPTAVAMGLTGGPLWTAKCTYITKVAKVYSKLVGEKSHVTMTRFFGIFFFFFHCCQIVENSISSGVLFKGVDELSISDELQDTCGFNYCPEFDSNLTLLGLQVPDSPLVTIGNQKLNIICGICLILSVLSAAIIVLFLDPLARFGDFEKDEDSKEILPLVIGTFQNLKSPFQLLLIPITIWSGIEQSYLSADFKAGFITCSIGAHMAGYVLLLDGICDTIFSVGFIPVVDSLGRIPVFLLATVLNFAAILVMFMWQPDTESSVMLYVLAAIWGTANAAWQTQVNALYGFLFASNCEAAFNNYRIWETLGFILGLVLSSTTCIAAKLGVNLFSLVLGIVGYVGVEYLYIRSRKQKQSRPS